MGRRRLTPHGDGRLRDLVDVAIVGPAAAADDAHAGQGVQERHVQPSQLGRVAIVEGRALIELRVALVTRSASVQRNVRICAASTVKEIATGMPTSPAARATPMASSM
jgi:hypothetical protein